MCDDAESDLGFQAVLLADGDELLLCAFAQFHRRHRTVPREPLAPAPSSDKRGGEVAGSIPVVKVVDTVGAVLGL